MCSACQPDGLGSGSESCLNCGGGQAVCSQTGCNTGVITTLDMFPLLGHPCSSSPNGVGVVAGVLGTHSRDVGEEFKTADWDAEGWLLTPWPCEEAISVCTVGSVSGSTTDMVIKSAYIRVRACACAHVCV